MRNRSKANGPGHWLCWDCFMAVTDSPNWKNAMWITPMDYRSSGGLCERCRRGVRAGEKAAKVTVDAPVFTS